MLSSTDRQTQYHPCRHTDFGTSGAFQLCIDVRGLKTVLYFTMQRQAASLSLEMEITAPVL